MKKTALFLIGLMNASAALAADDDYCKWKKGLGDNQCAIEDPEPFKEMAGEIFYEREFRDLMDTLDDYTDNKYDLDTKQSTLYSHLENKASFLKRGHQFAVARYLWKRCRSDHKELVYLLKITASYTAHKKDNKKEMAAAAADISDAMDGQIEQMKTNFSEETGHSKKEKRVAQLMQDDEDNDEDKEEDVGSIDTETPSSIDPEDAGDTCSQSNDISESCD